MKGLPLAPTPPTQMKRDRLLRGEKECRRIIFSRRSMAVNYGTSFRQGGITCEAPVITASRQFEAAVPFSFQAWHKCFIDGREIFIRNSNMCGLANKGRESESSKKKFVTALVGVGGLCKDDSKRIFVHERE